MRIAITGTGGIGKTTLVNALAANFNVPIITEDMQPVVTAINTFNQAQLKAEDLKAAQQAYHQACIDWLNNRAKQQLAHESFIADRFSFDLLARLVIPSLQKPDEALLMKIITVCKRQASRLDLIVMPPLMQMATKDMVNESGLNRHNDLGMKLFSHSLSRGLMEQMLDVPRLYIPLNVKTTSARVKLVEETLQKLNVK
jgi:predicted ATPase